MNSTSLSRTLWRLFGALLSIALLWQLRDAVMILFGAVLFAATLHALSQPLVRHTRLSASVATVIVLLGLIALTAGGLWWLGDPLAQQLQSLRDELPKAWDSAKRWLASVPLGSRAVAMTSRLGSGSVPWGNIANVASDVLRALSNIVLIALLGVYLALGVRSYRDGLVRLFPVARRSELGGAIDAAGHALSGWLVGQGVTMLAVGGAVAIGLSLIGMPLALALGVISGLLEFVPFFGPILSGLLAVLVAFVQGPEQALWAGGLFLVIQQVEGNLLVPLVQRWAVDLPPALAVGSVVVFGSLFGVWGVVFGTPLAVVTMVLVRKLYIEGHLEAAPSS